MPNDPAAGSIALIPTPHELSQMSDEVAKGVIQLADRTNQRETRYAGFGMGCGALCFISCLASYVYLVMNGHPEAAGAALGTAVLAIVGQFVNARMRK